MARPSSTASLRGESPGTVVADGPICSSARPDARASRFAGPRSLRARSHGLISFCRVGLGCRGVGCFGRGPGWSVNDGHAKPTGRSVREPYRSIDYQGELR